jgi:hypothetical protein
MKNVFTLLILFSSIVCFSQNKTKKSDFVKITQKIQNIRGSQLVLK